MKRTLLYNIALWIAAIGCINVGLSGLFGFDLVAIVFWNIASLAMLTYGLIGLSGIYVITEWFIRKKAAKSKKVDWPYGKIAKPNKKDKTKQKASATDMTS